MNKSAGPFFPTTAESMRISMAGDDCSLHFELEELTPKQQADHVSNQVLTGMLQVALLYIAKAEDVVCLYEDFRSVPWAQDGLARYHRQFQRLGLEPLPLDRAQFHPREGFYDSVAETPGHTELETLYMVSGANTPLHRDPAALTASRNLNSKAHFAAHAPAFGLPVPATLVTTKGELASADATAFMARHGLPMMLKTLGLAGARNVTTIATPEEADAYLAEYDADFPVILQARLDTSRYREMTVDLFVSTDAIRVTNVRQILFADGLWVGNLMGPDVQLASDDEATLLQVGAYAREHGYRSDTGFNLGIDYFVDTRPASDEPRLIITEINARWTGGLFPAELVRRLGISNRQVVAFIDMCPPEHFSAYMDFVDKHLHGYGSAGFGIAPMGFAPYVSELDGTEQIFVWQIVVDDFEAFKTAKLRELPDTALPTAPVVRIGL